MLWGVFLIILSIKAHLSSRTTIDGEIRCWVYSVVCHFIRQSFLVISLHVLGYSGECSIDTTSLLYGLSEGRGLCSHYITVYRVQIVHR